MLRPIFMTAIALFTIACGPMEVEVINETGADLVLDMPDQQEIVPTGTTLFNYKGAPGLNKRWTIPISVDGDYVVTNLSLDANRDAPTELYFGEGDINAFAVEVQNTTSTRVDSLFIQSMADGTLTDGQRPGRNFGPILPGESVQFSLIHQGSTGYQFVYYQEGVGTVDTSGELNTEAPGQDLQLAL